MMTSRISGAPICAGGASPLRVATGGTANWVSAFRSRRSPARANRRRDSVLRGLEDASLFQSSENHGEPLTHIGHLFITNPRASLRSDNCPISIGMGVRFGLEQVSAFVGIRTLIRVTSCAALTDKELSVEMVEGLLRDILHQEAPYSISIEVIQKKVAGHRSEE